MNPRNPKKNNSLLKSSSYCFACGKKNPFGLKLKIFGDKNGVWTTFKVKQYYEGFKDITHGGIVATILDEMIAWACRKRKLDVLTAELIVRYKKKLIIGEKIQAFGKVVKEYNRLIIGESLIKDSNGQIIATGQAKMLLV
ncbi:MAG: PaaI family thioesterase [candidate division WOR-3 bacterium]